MQFGPLPFSQGQSMSHPKDHGKPEPKHEPKHHAPEKLVHPNPEKPAHHKPQAPDPVKPVAKPPAAPPVEPIKEKKPERPPLSTEAGVVALMEKSQTKAEWKAHCETVKSANGGNYPKFWFAAVVQARVLERVAHRWGSDGKLKLRVIDGDGNFEDMDY